jgi:hypothetical protein
MSNYKLGLLIFSNAKAEGPSILQMFNKVLQIENFGVVKSVEILDKDPRFFRTVLVQYKITKLGMIVMVAPDADKFFPYSELEEVGQQNEKYLVTLNLDTNLEKNLLRMIHKVKASPEKPFKGCDSSCR